MTTGRSPGELTVIGWGAGSLDLGVPTGEMGVPVLEDGDKSGWGPYAQGVFDDHMSGRRTDIRERIGGNIVNLVADTNEHPELSIAKIAIVTVYGPDDIASQKIGEHIDSLGIAHIRLVEPGAKASIGIVHHRFEGADRAIRGSDREGSFSEHPVFGPDFVQKTTEGADIVVASSLKDPEGSRTVAENTDAEAFTAIVPGSTEYKKAAQRDALIQLLHDVPHDFWALNTQEAAAITGKHGESAEVIVRAMTKLQLARQILVTAGKEGGNYYIVGNNDAVHGESQPAEREVSTIGAGDASAAAGMIGTFLGRSPEVILDDVARAGADAVQYHGGHGHLPTQRMR
jgi:sugar/nucleoside kinase (ribokinase family)